MNAKMLAKSVLVTVREWVEPAFASVFDRIESVERKLSEIPAGPPGERGKDGRDADPVLIEKLVQASVTNAVAMLPKPQDGKDGKSIDSAFIVAEIERAVENLPKPRDGADGRDADPAQIAAAIADGAAIVNQAFSEMADELIRGLEDEAGAPTLSAASPSLSLHINTAESAVGKPSGLTAREQHAIGTMITTAIRDTLMLPVKPVYDDKGKLLYGQRVSSVE